VDREITPTQLFVVARSRPELYEYLKSRHAGDASVAVVLDRRLATRRRRPLAAAAERRRADRRSRPEVDAQLAATALAVVGGPAAPPSEAREWIDAMQRGVQAVRGALDSQDQLRHEALAARLDNERLRAEIDRSSKELNELDAILARAIELVNDLRSRLNQDPSRDATR
jgi:hypothetical protein